MSKNWPDAHILPDLSAHQREQYTMAAHGSLGILGGRPGTGKTFSLARILGAIPRARAAVAAPTGKAAVRITESLAKAGVPRMRATTIHSLLKVTSADDGWSFEHDESNPLPLDWIFIDEFSMVDCPLLGHLLAARAPGCRVLAVGDVNQLAPVGHGAPLRDLIAAGLPYGELTEIQRNSGRIVKACHTIIDHHRFEPSAKLDLEAESPENLIHVERREPGQQIETLKSMLERFRMGAKIAVRDADGAIVHQLVNPVWDVQIMVPVNEKSELGRKPLNRILQGFLNPGGERVDGNNFRTGDKICCTQNGWRPAERDIPKNLRSAATTWNAEQKDDKVYTANGELAQVLAVFPRYTVARLWNPDRIIRIPQGQSYENEDGETENSGCNFELGYVLSVHRSQGSEWPVTITVIDGYSGARMLCTREWLYTALSRAKTLGITMGQRELADSMCRKSGLWNRKTFLRESIAELRQASLAQAWASAIAGA